MVYESKTEVPGLKALFEQLMPSLGWAIDIPSDLQSALKNEEVVSVFNGTVPKLWYGLPLEDQTRIAMMAMNAFRLLLEAHVDAGGDYHRPTLGLSLVSDNMLQFLLQIETGAAYVALRNAYGPEYANRDKGNPNIANIIRFGARHWMPIYLKIRAEFFN